MKPPTVFLGEMTNSELETFLESHHTVIVPVGATEQHGPHSPLATDVIIPLDIARRVAPQVGAVVAPPLPYTLSYPHVGFTGVVRLRIPTFMSTIEDLCHSFATMGMKRIVFLNGHYDNTYAIAYACAMAAETMPRDVKAYPVNYWDGIAPDVAAQWSGLQKGMHAHTAEVSAVMAIDPDLVDTALLNAEFPPFPAFTIANVGAVHTAYFFSAPGSVYSATTSGTWGESRDASPEKGEAYLAICAQSTIDVMANIEQTFAAMPPR